MRQNAGTYIRTWDTYLVIEILIDVGHAKHRRRACGSPPSAFDTREVDWLLASAKVSRIDFGLDFDLLMSVIIID